MKRRWVSGNVDEVKIPIDDGTRGIDFLVLVVVEEFQEAATKLQFKDNELFVNFVKVLCGEMKQKWLTVIDSITTRDMAAFNSTLTELYKAIVGPKQRDVIKAWLENQCRKPMSSTPLLILLMEWNRK